MKYKDMKRYAVAESGFFLAYLAVLALIIKFLNSYLP